MIHSNVRLCYTRRMNVFVIGWLGLISTRAQMKHANKWHGRKTNLIDRTEVVRASWKHLSSYMPNQSNALVTSDERSRPKYLESNPQVVNTVNEYWIHNERTNMFSNRSNGIRFVWLLEFNTKWLHENFYINVSMRMFN